MTPDEILRAAHKDGTWDDWVRFLMKHGTAFNTVGDFFDAANTMILERAKRREALGVDSERDWKLDSLEDQRRELIALRARNAELEAQLAKYRTALAAYSDPTEMEIRAMTAESERDDLKAQIEACKPYLQEGETPVRAIESLDRVNRAAQAELTALRSRKPNYKAAFAAYVKAAGAIRPGDEVARKIADAAFEPQTKENSDDHLEKGD